jgi:beta-galactosidase
MHKWMAAAVLGLAVAGCTTAGSGEQQARVSGDRPQREMVFDGGWQFHLGDVPGAEAAGFDSAGWRTLDLPHDWGIEGPFDAKWASGQAYLPGGIGWYRKAFDVEDVLAGERVVLRFDGVYEKSQVWVNGQEAGGRPFGYSTFWLDITPYLRAKGNVVAVRVDHSEFADSRWYTGSGIFRHVFLMKEPALHVEENGGVFVWTEGGKYRTTVRVRNDSGADAEMVVVNSVRDSAGWEVARTEQASSVKRGTMRELTADGDARSPVRWSVEHPVMYALRTEVKVGGRVVDAVTTPFGFRDVKFTPDKGLFVNGESVKMKGVCLHEDAGVLGAAVPVEVWERRLRILKELGCNAIRTSHNPPAPEFLDLCDRLGFLVMDEAFDEWDRGKKKWVDGWNGKKFSTDGYHEFFEAWADRDLRDMVRRDRNHPSIIMWSIGNEIDYPNDPYAPNDPHLLGVAQRLVQDVRVVDTTRPVTAACAAIRTNLFFPALDIVGYNYQEQLYAEDHAKDPSRIMYGSENKTDGGAWAAVRDNEFISGQFLWTGIDYLGEARAFPNHTSASGLLNEAGFLTRRGQARAGMWGGKGDRPSIQGAPVGLEVKEYPTEFGPGHGKHVAQLEVAAVDGSGVLVPDQGKITVSVKGAARFLGIENGDANDAGDYHAATRPLRGGRAVVYVEVTGEAEVQVMQEGGKGVVVKVNK